MEMEKSLGKVGMQGRASLGFIFHSKFLIVLALVY